MFLRLFLAAGVATILAACTSESENGPSANISYESIAATQQVPVTFGTYWGEQAITRSGYAKNMTLDALKTNSFGVFAYHTPENGSGKYLYWNTATASDNATKLANDYPSATAANFMFNQKVTFGTDWGYTPIKYWPNDFNNGGAVDDGGATGTSGVTGYSNDNVSFFAYAPYVDFSTDATVGLNGTSPATANTYGITAINGETTLANANVKAQDPILTYKLNSTYPVDLLWGTAGATDANVNGATPTSSYTATAEGTPQPSKFPVNVNLTKQKIGGKVKFAFKHALAGLGGGSSVSSTVGFQAVLDIDKTIPPAAITGGTRETFDLDADATPDAWRTIITIKDIEITNDLDGNGNINDSETGFYTDGTFNLATGLWIGGTSGVISQKIGTSGVGGVNAILNTKLAELYDSTPTTWFTQLTSTQVSDYFDYTNTQSATDDHPGVMESEINVYNDPDQSPLLFIPDPSLTPKIRVTVDYVVRTYDENLSGECSVVNQKISKVITFPAAAFEVNKHYNLIMRLGLTGVKFDASVDNWTEGAVQTVNLPINVE